MRIVLDHNPLAPIFDPETARAQGRAQRPAWIVCGQRGQAPEVLAYRLRFSIAAAATARVHVSADERYELWLDGRRVGRGPERGSDRVWFYETYDLSLAAGEHVLFARVWHLGDAAPVAQVSQAHGFLLAADPPFDTLLSTGKAAWEVKPHAGYAFDLADTHGLGAWFVGANQSIDAAAFPWGVEGGAGDGWQPVVARYEDELSFVGHVPLHVLEPALLPAPLSAARGAGTVRFVAAAEWDDPHAVFVASGANRSDELETWQAMLDGGPPAVVPPRTRRQVIVDLDQYYCAYPQIVTTGGQGGTITVCWAEALHLQPASREKGQRDVVEGRYFVAPMRDVIHLDGGAHRRFESLWWRAGRYLQLLVQTADEALTVESIGLEETRYPLEMESRIATGDPRLDRVVPLAVRTLQMCAHETYMDCPYYEQLMYVGDTRLQVLTTYAISRDDRLPRKALTLFDLSRLPSGLTQARYPSRIPQLIPPFSLWWIGMVHDYAMWRDDRPFVARLLPGVRAVVDGFLQLVNAEGVLAAPVGWNFADWVPDWPAGVPPDASNGVSGLLNWHLVYTLGLAQQLEEWAGEPELARRLDGRRQELARRLVAHFWDDQRGLFADDLAHAHFSEHTQSLALLSGLVDDERPDRIAQSLLGDATLTRTTIYFTHYLFETYRLLQLASAMFDRLQLWLDLPGQGFKTMPEQPEPSRSDCHAWSAHPLFHCFATILGIRPAAFGFGRVEIAPLLGPLRSISGSLVHPRGSIDVRLQAEQGRVSGTVSLPEGVAGTFRYAGTTRELGPGLQHVDTTSAARND